MEPLVLVSSTTDSHKASLAFCQGYEPQPTSKRSPMSFTLLTSHLLVFTL